MNKLQILILVLALSLTNCDVVEVTPTVTFDLKGINDQEIFLTSSIISTVNDTENGASYMWDFGNGVTSTEEEPTFSFDKSGTYLITLTAKSPDGIVRSSSKEINVLDRVLKEINITSLNFSELNLDLDDAEKNNVFITIKQYRTKEGNPADILIYQSEVLNLSVNDLPHTVGLNQKIVIDHSLVSSGLLSFNIHAATNEGYTIIGSNLFSGGSVGQWSIQGRPYALATSSTGGSLILECNFE